MARKPYCPRFDIKQLKIKVAELERSYSDVQGSYNNLYGMYKQMSNHYERLTAEMKSQQGWYKYWIGEIDNMKAIIKKQEPINKKKSKA